MSYCINPETKDYLIEAVENVGIPTEKEKEIKDFIKSLDKCTTDEVSKGRKGKRPLSKYNIYMSHCMKGTGKQIGECSISWNEHKKKSV